MTTKKLDKALDVCLWIVFGLLVVASFLFSNSFKAPKFEVVETDIKIPYVYYSDDGEKYDSFYVPAWKHEAFSRPKVAVYDPRNGKNAEIKPEYVEDYKAEMPESAYPFYTRWTWGIFALLAAAAALFTYFVGGFFRDMILYLKLKSNPTFENCAYFLYEDRIGFKSSVKKLIGHNIGVYIKTKSQELYKKYREDFAGLLIHILNNVRYSNDTEVLYYLSYNNLTTDQKTYLTRLRSYWDGMIGKSSNAEENILKINQLLEMTYLPISLLINEHDIYSAVDRQLNKLFTGILGSEVLKFNAAEHRYAKAAKLANKMFIDINVRNHSRYFTWSGSAVPAGTSIPGLEIEFKIYHFVNGTEKVLWDKYLVPVCTYQAKDDEFAASELYKKMVIQTIETFDQSEKA